jgi:hypothetical protein
MCMASSCMESHKKYDWNDLQGLVRKKHGYKGIWASNSSFKSLNTIIFTPLMLNTIIFNSQGRGWHMFDLEKIIFEFM